MKHPIIAGLIAVLLMALPVCAKISACSGVYRGNLLKASNGKFDSIIVMATTTGGRATGASYSKKNEAYDVINPNATVVRSDNTASGKTLSGATFKGKFTVSSKSGKFVGTANGDTKYKFTLTRIYK